MNDIKINKKDLKAYKKKMTAFLKKINDADIKIKIANLNILLEEAVDNADIDTSREICDEIIELIKLSIKEKENVNYMEFADLVGSVSNAAELADQEWIKNIERE